MLLERLDAHHDVSTFDSGNDMLDGWLRRHALAAQRMDSARTFVATRGGRVVGYFSLTMGSVLRADAPAKLVRGMPAYPVGMVLLARLAVDQSQQGKGVGAMQRMLGCSDETVSLVEGGRVVVDGVYHDETGCGDLPRSNCLSQCFGEKHCANAFSLL